MKRIVFWSMAVFLLLVIVTCGSGKAKGDYDDVDTLCSCPHTVIYLQPYDDFTQKEAQKLKDDMQKQFKELAGQEFEINILPAKHLTASLMNDKKTRYRATKILNAQKINQPNGTTIIGVTHKDISTTLHGVNDYGIMGLSYSPGTVCVVSDYRVKKNMLWKVALHEFFHAFGSMPHCQSGDDNCIMQDAKGKNPIPRETHFCEQCKDKMP